MPASLDEQRKLFEDELAPVFDSKLVRRLADLPAAYFGLGIPPAQFDALKADAGGNLATLLRARRRAPRLRLPDPRELVRLAGLRPPLSRSGRGRCRPICGRRTSPSCASGVERVTIEQITFTDFLRRQDARTVDAYVLLDAQDWMSRAQITALWAEIEPHGARRAPG